MKSNAAKLTESDSVVIIFARTLRDELASHTAVMNLYFSRLIKIVPLAFTGQVDIRVPLYKDLHTDDVELEHGITMDAMGYGMGCCCLQVCDAPLSLWSRLLFCYLMCVPYGHVTFLVASLSKARSVIPLFAGYVPGSRH